jgi:hypothetical protein
VLVGSGPPNWTLIAAIRFARHNAPIQFGAFFARYRRARSLVRFLNYMTTVGIFGVLAAEARW